MTATATISRPLRKLLAAGPAIYRDGNTLMTGDACPVDLLPELEALCLPRISEADGRTVVALLKEHAGRVRGGGSGSEQQRPAKKEEMGSRGAGGLGGGGGGGGWWE